jgi:uncharacterized RDD family membrane protein YckC
MENPEQASVVASRKRRLAAFLIDHFVISFSILVGGFFLYTIVFKDEYGFKQIISTTLCMIIGGAVLYFAKDSIGGLSFGKWIMGIRVRDAKDQERVPSFGRLFLRNMLFIIWPVECFALLLSDDKKRLGDRVAKTSVLRNPRKIKLLPRIVALCLVLVSFIAALFLFTLNRIKDSDAYKRALTEIELNKRIMEETGGIEGYGAIPSGSIHYSNGLGTAEFKIKVFGKKKDLIVLVYLEKRGYGIWELSDETMKIDRCRFLH